MRSTQRRKPELRTFCRVQCVLLLVFALSIAEGQTITSVSGVVLDASNGTPLPAATVRVAGSSNKGTITNERGQFQLLLPSGDYSLIVSYLGYRSDTLRISAAGAHDVRAILEPEAIRMAEVVVTDEDPAVEIIRRAIESKPKWMGALKTFQCEAYSRSTMSIDSSIGAITEAFISLHWRASDSLREVVHQRRQTKNLAIGEMVSRVGQVTNFNDDTIQTGGSRFIGPTSPDAFSFYEFRLLKTRFMDGSEVYDIEVTPKSRLRPLFRGTISIAEKSYAVIGVDFQPNEAFVIPFIQDLKFHYKQQFRLYEDRFWMPVDYRVEGGARLSIAGFTLMRISFNRYVVMSDYTINPGFADSVERLPRLTIAPEASKFDSTYWKEHQVLPLNADEERAYAQLDSSATLEKQMEKRTRSLTAIGAGLTGLSYVDLRFNRVEGPFLGGRFDFDSVSNSAALRGGLGYGFLDKMWKYSAGGTLYVTGTRSLGFGADIYRRLDNRPDEGYYGDFQILLGTLFSKDDYRDYFISRGWHAFVEGNIAHRPGRSNLTTQIGFTDEEETTLKKITEYSFFNRDRSYRPNPPIAEGTLRALTVDVHYGDALQYLLSNPYLLAHASVEYASKDFFASDFGFTRMWGGLKAKFPSYDLDLMFNPTLSISLSGGILTGARLPQRLFNLESSYYGSAWFGTLRAARVKEFSGDRFAMMNIEHNFRRVPFLASGIPYLYKSNLELIVFASVARSWLSAAGSAGSPLALPTKGYYYEGGLSISRILDLIRFDLTWRGSAPQNLSLTLGVGDLF